MKYSNQTKRALCSAVMAVGVVGVASHHAWGQTTTNTYEFNANAAVEIESSGYYRNGASYVDVNGSGEAYPNYNIMQFSTGGGQFPNSLATAVSPNFTMNLTDNDYSGETTTEPTTLNFFLVADTTATITTGSTLAYESSGALGGGLAAAGATGGFPASDSIYYLGTYSYTSADTTNTSTVPLSLDNVTSTLAPAGSSSNLTAAENYLLSQVQNAAGLRIVITDNNNDKSYVAFDGYASGTPPQLGLSVTYLTPTPNDSAIYISSPPAGDTANTATVNLGRAIVSYASFSSTLTVGNSATDAGASALVLASPNNGLDGSTAPSSPIGPSSTGTVTVGFNSSDTSGYQAGTTATGTVTFTDANNTASVINAQASVLLVDQRALTAGGTGNNTTAAINIGKVLVGQTGSVGLTLNTTNTNTNLAAGNDEGPDVLTTETLAAGAVSSPYSVKDPEYTGTVTVGTISATQGSSPFVFNSATGDSNITGSVTPIISGVYGDAHSYTGNTSGTVYYNGNYTSYSSTTGLTNDGTTAGEDDYADIYLQWQGYQAAAVSGNTTTGSLGSGNSGTTTVSLTNAISNDNDYTTSNSNTTAAYVNGLRAAAWVSGTVTFNSSDWSQTGISTVTTTGTGANETVSTGTTISSPTGGYSPAAGTGNSTASLSFPTANKLNGTYGATMYIPVENELDIQGASTSTLAPVAVALSASVISQPTVENGTYTFNGGTFTDPNTGTDLTGSFAQTAGTSTFNNLSGSGTVSISGGTTNFATISSGVKVYLTGSGSANVNGGTATFEPINTTGSLAVSGATAKLATNSGANILSSLSITNNGTLDIGNNHVIINYGSGSDPISSIAALIASGYNGGTWTGTGITSATAAANKASYGIGYADYSPTYNPAGLSSGQLEIAYTLLGDANLDYKVNGTDFTLMAANFNDSVTNGWDKGDFNYSNTVNGDDFVLLADNFNDFAGQSAVSAADLTALDDFAAANGISLTGDSSVPEPASLGLLAVGVTAGLARRRRKPAADSSGAT